MDCTEATPQTYHGLDFDSCRARQRQERGLRGSCESGWQVSLTPMWPLDALKAMETHLALLGKDSRRRQALLRISNCSKSDDNYESDCNESDDTGVVQSNSRPCATSANQQNTLVDLRSASPLPNGWEQFLDLRTGEIYFIDWNACKRSGLDPRNFVQGPNCELSLSSMQAHAGCELQSQITDLESSLYFSQSRLSYVKMENSEEMEVESSYRGDTIESVSPQTATICHNSLHPQQSSLGR
eukprot:c17596_g1_i1 orf=490-1212(-)